MGLLGLLVVVFRGSLSNFREVGIAIVTSDTWSILFNLNYQSPNLWLVIFLKLFFLLISDFRPCFLVDLDSPCAWLGVLLQMFIHVTIIGWTWNNDIEHFERDQSFCLCLNILCYLVTHRRMVNPFFTFGQLFAFLNKIYKFSFCVLVNFILVSFLFISGIRLIIL